MDKRQVIKTIHDLIPTLLTAFHVHKVILYGSWTEGYPDHDSDIDIAVVVHQTQDYLQSLIRLYELCSAFDVRIEPILFEYGHDPSGFLEYISRQGQVLYVSEKGQFGVMSEQ